MLDHLAEGAVKHVLLSASLCPGCGFHFHAAGQQSSASENTDTAAHLIVTLSG